MFSGYPGGRSGLALLMLRAASGIVLVVQGSLCLASPEPTWQTARGFIEVFSGASLTIGFLTPVAVLLISVAAGIFTYSLVPSCAVSLFDSRLAIAFEAVILACVLLLGPGALSLDARIFGRREIVIPVFTPRR